MTDPQNPAPAYSAAPAAPQGAPANAPVPGRTLGIVAFIVAFFASLIGLILGIVALVQSKKAGHKNGWALWAIILGAVFFVATIITWSVAGAYLAASMSVMN